MEVDEDEKKLVKGFAFLSEKPMIYVENIGEDQLDRLRHTDVSSEGAKPWLIGRNTEQTIISGKLEAEMSELPSEELKRFSPTIGLAESGTERLIRTTYRLLVHILLHWSGRKNAGVGDHHTAGRTRKMRRTVIHTDLIGSSFITCRSLSL